MDIHAEPGTKVIFSNPDAGYEKHQELAKRYLRVMVKYTVERTEVGRWHTNVYLEEVPGVAFNSVMFDDVVEE